MILDKQNLFSYEQAVTSTATSTDVVDLGAGDHGPSERASLVVTAKNYSAGPSAGITVEFQTSDELTSGALTSAVTVAKYPVTSAALVGGGQIVAARLPHGMKRYAGLNYSCPSGSGVTPPAGGTITGGLVLDVQQAETIIKP